MTVYIYIYICICIVRCVRTRCTVRVYRKNATFGLHNRKLANSENVNYDIDTRTNCITKNVRKCVTYVVVVRLGGVWTYRIVHDKFVSIVYSSILVPIYALCINIYGGRSISKISSRKINGRKASTYVVE